ncbi:MAG: DUF2493 domain-containing protein [Gammaproteobacteria bacterium]|jgi:hypothetical protein|nr:DUF2493 domain-containing protein [Gammaproteobacteria bacterium]
MKVAVIGSRTFANAALLSQTLDSLPITCVVSGGAKGADQLAADYARRRGIPIEVFKPDWRIGRAGGPLRNQKVVNACEQVVAFWDGRSRGTADAIKKARAAGRPVLIVEFGEPPDSQ